jgi:glutamate-1-semialdehyde aminotransferase
MAGVHQLLARELERFAREHQRSEALLPTDERADVGGIGGTAAGNVLSLAAMRATLSAVLTQETFDRMTSLGERFEAGVDAHTAVFDNAAQELAAC